MTKINILSRALSQCNLTKSKGDFLIMDRYGEIIGRLGLDEGGVRVFDNYEHGAKVMRRLKRNGIPCSYEDPAAGALKVLYDTPRGKPS